MLNVIKKNYLSLQFSAFLRILNRIRFFVPIRIRTQEKKAFRIRTKGPGSETLPSNEQTSVKDCPSVAKVEWRYKKIQFEIRTVWPTRRISRRFRGAERTTHSQTIVTRKFIIIFNFDTFFFIFSPTILRTAQCAFCISSANSVKDPSRNLLFITRFFFFKQQRCS